VRGPSSKSNEDRQESILDMSSVTKRDHFTVSLTSRGSDNISNCSRVINVLSQLSRLISMLRAYVILYKM
jgi:hypothetical protein